MQPCKTGDQRYSDASPYSECSLVKLKQCTFILFHSIQIQVLSKIERGRRLGITNNDDDECIHFVLDQKRIMINTQKHHKNWGQTRDDTLM